MRKCDNTDGACGCGRDSCKSSDYFIRKTVPYIPIKIELPDQVGVFDTQIGGEHYKDYILQPIEVILKWNLNFTLGNVIKYVYRAWKGNSKEKQLEDLRKAKHYLEIEIDRLQGE